MSVVAQPATVARARGIAVGAIRELAVAGVAGMLLAVPAGLLARLVMKVSAVAAGPAAVGTLTENGNVVGDLTLDGTVALILFAGLAPAVGGALVYRAAHPWLVRLGRGRGVALALAFLALTGGSVIDARNLDFTRFGPAALNIALFVVLFVVTGVALAPVVDAVHRAAGAPSVPQLAAFAAGLALAALLIVGMAMPLVSLANGIVLTSAEVAGLRTLVAIGLAFLARSTMGVTPLTYVILALPVLHGAWDLAGAVRSLLA